MLVADTLLIDGLSQDELLLERILALDGRFAKFRKVLNDERVASVLSLEDIANMLGVESGALLDFVNGRAPMNLQPATSELPTSSQIGLRSITGSLDLRPLFERGLEPLMTVLEAVAALQPRGVLMVEAPFHPVPLRRLLAGRGFESHAAQVSSEHWQVLFSREDPNGGRAMQ